jgi:hypothetical protein
MRDGQRALDSLGKGDIFGAIAGAGRVLTRAGKHVPQHEDPPATTVPNAAGQTTANGTPVVLPPMETAPGQSTTPVLPPLNNPSAGTGPNPTTGIVTEAEQSLHQNLANWRATQRISALEQGEMIKAGIYSAPGQVKDQILTNDQTRFLNEFRSKNGALSPAAEAQAEEALQFNLKSWREVQKFTAEDQIILLQNGAYKPPA